MISLEPSAYAVRYVMVDNRYWGGLCVPLGKRRGGGSAWYGLFCMPFTRVVGASFYNGILGAVFAGAPSAQFPCAFLSVVLGEQRVV